MSIAPYIFFPGTCAEAMTAYCDILGGGDLEIMRQSDMPPGEGEPVPEGDAVMHASFLLGGRTLMASDYPAGMDWPGQAGSAVHVTLPDAGAARAAFDRLAEGGEVTMPFTSTFWSKGFGMLRDRWGTSWMISTPD
jgi:PhnB protein